MSISAPHLPIALSIPLAWGEQDAFGHLNNVVYFRYFENVRMYVLERVGILRSHTEQGIGVLLATTTCDFLRPVVWPDTLEVRTGCTHVGNTSFTLTYTITDDQRRLVANGTSVQVMFDYGKGHKVTIPPDIRAALEKIRVA